MKPFTFSFLPTILIKKFEIILGKYKQIKRGTSSKINIDGMFESDSQINKIKSCKSEKELWELSEGFIRRIYRLTKYYKGFKSC